MLEKVFYMSVLVSDQDKALDFYTNVLGSRGTASSWFSGPGHRARPSLRWEAPRRRSR